MTRSGRATRRSGATSAEESQDALAVWESLNNSSAVIEFDLEGIVLSANANFLELMGYREDELIGKHHSLLMPPEETTSAAYKQFWNNLRKGQFFSGEFRRCRKDGSDVWLQASYNPVHDTTGKPQKIVKLALDITAIKNENAAQTSMITAIERSMAVIEFKPDGTIVKANDIFLEVMGYTLEEIVGKHHRIFVEKEEAASADYKQFWAALGRGECQRAQFKRLNKAGESVWLEACYNPILDASGKLVEVVKFAYDVTDAFNQAMAVLGEKSAQLEAALEEAHEAERVRLELDRTLQEMSTPVTPIWEGILLLPLVGIVDSTRTDDVMRKTLDRISQTGSRMFILDISGVPTVDTAVANQLIKITKATRIMGCETLVSGVASSIAHTIVELGVDISELRTTATLRDAFFTCLTEMGILSVGAGGYGQGGYGQGGYGQPGPQPMMHRPSQRQLHIH
ncbi:MAG: PAS domain S-box protein [Vulcanococcus sp.]